VDEVSRDIAESSSLTNVYMRLYRRMSIGAYAPMCRPIAPRWIMFRNREQLSILSRPAEDWVDFPPSPGAEFSRASAKNRKAAPALPIPFEPSGPNKGANATAPALEAKRRRGIRAIVLSAALLAVLGAASYFGSHWWTVGRFLVSTDDAYVGAKSATLAAKI